MKIWKKDYYESLFRECPRTIQDYQLIIAHAQEKIEELRNSCKHENTRPETFYGILGGYVKNICSSCGKMVD